MPEVVVSTPGLRLRSTRREDLSFVRAAEAAAENRGYVEQWSEADHSACVDADDCCHLLIEDDRESPIGYVILEGLRDPGRAMLLRRIVVVRKGEGIGRRAVKAIMRYCFETLGFRRLWLEVHDDNMSARTLYEHLGFRVESVAPSEDGRYTMVRMSVLDRDYRASRPARRNR